MSSVEAVGCGGFGETGTQKAAAALERFLGACVGGQDIEEIILRGTARQKKLAGIVRSTHRESQRRAVAEAARKINDAAWKGVYSALFGTAVQLAATCICYELDVASGLARSGAGSERVKLLLEARHDLYSGLVKAGGALCERFTPWTDAEAGDRAAAEVLQTEAGIRGQQAAEVSDWLRDIKELEQKLVSHLEKAMELEHQAKKTVIDRMGS